MGKKQYYIPAGVTTGADVELNALHLGNEVGEGGQGRVLQINGSRLAYKSYYEPKRIRGDAMTRLVEFRQSCPPADRRWLDSHCAWPMCRVVDGGIVVGFIMRRAENEYTWKDTKGKQRLVELQFLIRDAKIWWQQIVQPDPDQRRQLALAFADLVRRLHRWNVVIGDISDVNILWRLSPSPDVYILDCDGMRIRGNDPILDQADTPDWHDPLMRSRIPGLDADLYKTALAIARILCCQPQARPGEQLAFVTGTLGDRESAVRRLFKVAAGGPGTRPEGDRWVRALGDGASPKRE